ncbi:hypothetical protein CHS0354_001568 [Potamilus streckersoni]|uniref:Uncharacterized protein n=1 Tax=Potamilus streckersoni TaxID=2493646 RepID=A0AAE0SI89_9BIVA|nr:hypothetical protein CHS0354_001568 [Potamilus streckersoni]
MFMWLTVVSNLIGAEFLLTKRHRLAHPYQETIPVVRMIYQPSPHGQSSFTTSGSLFGDSPDRCSPGRLFKKANRMSFMEE